MEIIFPALAPHLLEFKGVNPIALLQLTGTQSFLFFVAFSVVVSCHPFNVPVVGFDSTHFRHRELNGVILSLIGRNGNGQNVKLAKAFVHVENKDKIACIFI